MPKAMKIVYLSVHVGEKKSSFGQEAIEALGTFRCRSDRKDRHRDCRRASDHGAPFPRETKEVDRIATFKLPVEQRTRGRRKLPRRRPQWETRKRIGGQGARVRLAQAGREGFTLVAPNCEVGNSLADHRRKGYSRRHRLHGFLQDL